MPITLLFAITVIWLPILLVVAYDVLWDLKIWQNNNYSVRRVAHALRWDFSASHRHNLRMWLKVVLGLSLSLYLIAPASPLVAFVLILIYSLWVNDAINIIQKLLKNEVPYLRPHFRVTLIYTILTLIFAAAALVTASYAVFFAAALDYNFAPATALQLFPSWAYSLTIFIFIFGLILDLGSPVLTAALVIITKPEQWLVTRFFLFRAQRKLRQNKHLAIVLVAGSYGKTSIKNLLASLLEKEFHILKLREEETLAGIAKEIAYRLTVDTQVFICDINELVPGELQSVARLLRPQLLLLTGLDETYLGIYGSEEALVRNYEKALALMPGGTLISNGSDDLLRQIVRENIGKEVLYFPNPRSVDIEDNQLEAETLHIDDVQLDSKSAYVLLQFQSHSVPLEMPSRYAHFLPSIMPTLLAARELGMTDDQAVAVLPQQLSNLNDNEEISGDNETVILYHPARSTLDNLELSIAKLHKYSGDKYLITSGIQGLGKRKKALYKDLAQTIREHIQVLITFDKDLANAVRWHNHQTEIVLVHSIDDLIYEVSIRQEPGDVILLHGPTDPHVLEALRSQG